MGKQYKEVGRCLATVMVSDKLFHEVSYKTSEREHLVAAMDKFLDDTTVLPR